MTRRLLILSLCIVLTLAAQAKKETQDFVTQFMTELQNDSHVSEDDYRCVTVSPQMMERVLQMMQANTLKDEDQIRDALTHIRSLRVFTATDNIEIYSNKNQKLLKRNARQYKRIRQTEDSEAEHNMQLWVREANNQIVELVLINSVSEDLFQIINFTGDFDREFIDELLKM